MYSYALSLTSALDGNGGQRHAPVALLPGKRPGTHCTGGWVGPRASLDGCGKPRPYRDSIPPTAQPVASRYVDYTPQSSHVLFHQCHTIMETLLSVKLR